MKPGLRVRCIRTGRRGVVTEVIDPPRLGRNLYVVWGTSIDFSLMAAHEIVADVETPGGAGRQNPADPDWRSLLTDSDLDAQGGDGD